MVMGAAGPLARDGAGFVPRRRERVAREALAFCLGHPVTECRASWALDDRRPDIHERHLHAAPRPRCDVATATASVFPSMVIVTARCSAMPCTMGPWAATAHGATGSPRVGRARSTWRVRQCREPGGTKRCVMARVRSRRKG
jgi:hypothetical protein